MNKKAIDALIPEAFVILEEVGIAKNKTIPKGFRGQIASFGAAVAMGSLLAAVSFFSHNNEDGKEKNNETHGLSSVDRTLLIKAIYKLLPEDEKLSSHNLFEYIKMNNNQKTKEKIYNACIALKLAMNLYSLE